MNAVVPINPQLPAARSLSAVDMREHVNLIQEVMQAVMKKDTHYGVIPGCKQPSLYKAGSEVLLTTFRVAVSVFVEDLSTDDSIRYRVRTVGTHQGSGIVVGEGIGECSSNEEKYKWRRCYNKKEFDATTESRRRIKYTKYGEDMQVRTEPADVANTVLKMAKKRAQIDLTLTATAASDIFTQDVEDIPDELREQHVEEADTEAANIAKRKTVHDEALGRHSESVAYIKERLSEDNFAAAGKEWALIPVDDQLALWLATSKGGCLTTAERAAIKDKCKPVATENPNDN